MGVKGLQTYIDEHCRDVMQRVCIFNIADRHRQNFRGSTPTLVIDAMSLLQSLYDEHLALKSFFGGQWVEYSNGIKEFIKKFTNVNIRLVFFFDGCVVENKREEWINRRNQNCENIEEIFRKLKNGIELSEKDDFKKPTGIGSLTRMAIKILCPEVGVYSTLNDADAEIASYAKEHDDVFGILSNDTDFIIFNTKPYFDIRHLDYDNMTTMIYDRNRLAEHLSLRVEQFPLFSCLMGNDFVSKQLLRQFHRQSGRSQEHQRGRYSQRHQPRRYSQGHQRRRYSQGYGYQQRSEQPLAEKLSSVIRNNNWSGVSSNSEEMRDVSLKISGSDNLRQIIAHGIEMYTELDNLKKASCRLSHRHVECIIMSHILNIYEHQVYESSEVLEDPEGNDLSETNLTYESLRQRLYGLIFCERIKTNEVVKIKEYCANVGSVLENDRFVTPISGLEYSMEELWDKDYSMQMKYFRFCMNIRIPEIKMRTMESKFFALCCIINYLLTNLEPAFLQTFEVAAFIAQAVYIQDKSPSFIQEIEDPPIDTRAIHICSIFMKGVETIIMALGVCGYPISCEDAMPWNYFDGKTFHKMYESTKQNTPIEELLDGNEDSLRLYKELYDIATSGVE